MFYYIHQSDSKFFSYKESLPQFVKPIHDFEPYHYSWVDDWCQENDDLKKVFFYWRWNIHFHNKQNIINNSFDRERLGNDGVLLQAIAPFVCSIIIFRSIKWVTTLINQILNSLFLKKTYHKLSKPFTI